MSVWAVVVAAGEGSRFGGPKAFAPLAGMPMVAHSLVVLAKAPSIAGVVLVAGPGHLDEARAVAAASIPTARAEVVAGGATRQASVLAGLNAVPGDAGRVLVHDAARPLVSVALVEAVVAALDGAPGAIAAVAERDTLKREHAGSITETVERSGVWRAQTPQGFHAQILRAAHRRAVADGFEATDDAMLLERLGERVAIVPGDERNIKVTTAADLAIAEALLAGGGAS
jgi:2-C-methyl-D-erythritol 4-phosphate cytidylyltransferase